jgi:hypothetical protein
MFKKYFASKKYENGKKLYYNKDYKLALDLFIECAPNLKELSLDAHVWQVKCLFELGKYEELLNHRFKDYGFNKRLIVESAFRLEKYELAFKILSEEIKSDIKIGTQEGQRQREDLIKLRRKLFNIDITPTAFWVSLDYCLKKELLSEINKSEDVSNFVPNKKHIDNLRNATILNLNHVVQKSNYGKKLENKPYWLEDLDWCADIKKIKNLNLAGQYKIHNLENLEQLTLLEELNLAYAISDDRLNPISKLKTLKHLNLGYPCSNKNTDIDLSFLHGLSLTSLELAEQTIKDFSPLDGMKCLTHLSLKGTNIISLRQISNLQNLQLLIVSDCSKLNLSDIVKFSRIELFYCDKLTPTQYDSFVKINPNCKVYEHKKTLYDDNTKLNHVEIKFEKTREESGYLADHNKKFNDFEKHFNHQKKVESLMDYPKFFTPQLYDKSVRKEFVDKEILTHKVDAKAQNVVGISEKYFQNYIENVFKDKYIVGGVLPSKGNGNSIVPDFLLFDKLNNIYLDIEIDEPYVWKENIITHFIGADFDRDFIVTQANWFILKFTEEQIITNPLKAIEVIKDTFSHIQNLSSGEISNFCNTYDSFSIKAWSKEDCTRMMIDNYRETYLKKYLELKSESSIKKTLDSVTPRSDIFYWWQKLNDTWQRAISEAVFHQPFICGFIPSEQEFKYLLSLKELKFVGASDWMIGKNLNTISFVIDSLNGIEHLAFLPNLKQINISHNDISDLNPISAITNLEGLDANYNVLEDISCLGSLKNLRYLYLTGAKIHDISVIRKLNKISNLTLVNTNVYDIMPLFDLTKPYSISLYGCKLKKSQVVQFQILFPDVIFHYDKHKLIDL